MRHQLRRGFFTGRGARTSAARLAVPTTAALSLGLLTAAFMRTDSRRPVQPVGRDTDVVVDKNSEGESNFLTSLIHRRWFGGSTTSLSSDSPSPSATVASAADNPLRLSLAGTCQGKACAVKSTELSGCGEDAYFINEDAQAFGVADGVGGWTLQGVDPGEMSRAMMINCSKVIARESAGETLIEVYYAVARSGLVEAGSTTACVAKLEPALRKTDVPEMDLSVANVGDSGVLVVRSGEIVFSTPSQQHHFNCPYQLTAIPPGYTADTPVDVPEEAVLQTFAVREGDIVIACTDGVLDNLFPEDIAQLASRLRVEQLLPQDIADGILLQARMLASGSSRTPFEEAAAEVGLLYRGGKLDDIAVVVGLVESTDTVDESSR